MTPCKLARLAMILVVAVAALAGGGGNARAQSCSLSIGNLSFGTVNLISNTQDDTTAAFEVSCDGGTPGQTMLACINLGPGSGDANGANAPRYLDSGGSKLGYNIFLNSGHTLMWGSYSGGGSPMQLLLPLDSSGRGSTTGVVYGRIYGGQQTLPTGSYSSSFASVQDVFLAWTPYSGADCTAIGTANQTAISAPFAASVSYPASCTVSAGTMNFGNMTDLKAAVESSALLSTTCSAGTPYAITLGDGLNATGPMQRAMSYGGQRLTYDLFQDSSRLTAWGGAGNALAATGTGLPQSRNVFGRVPAQTTPPPGVYQDTVVVTVGY